MSEQEQVTEGQRCGKSPGPRPLGWPHPLPKATLGQGPCDLPRGHDGDHVGLPPPPLEAAAQRYTVTRPNFRNGVNEAFRAGAEWSAARNAPTFREAWKAAVAHGLVDEFSDGLDAEEDRLKRFLAEIRGGAT